MKHAYLIMAHHEPELFAVLIDLLDDIRNDIYVMIDAKVDISPFRNIQTKYSQLIFLENRIANYWGMYTQIESELALFEAAHTSDTEYSYYHLLSGVDLPLKTQDEIHSFFEKNNLGRADGPIEYLGFSTDPTDAQMTWKKVYRYHLFQKHLRSESPIAKFFFLQVRRISNLLQHMFNYQRHLPQIELHKGHTWVSLSDHAITYLLSQRSLITTLFKGSECGDEIYKHTLLWNYPPLFRNIYISKSENEGCVREIDWKRGGPLVWNITHKEELLNSKMLFARKFTMKTESGKLLVEELVRRLKTKGKTETL